MRRVGVGAEKLDKKTDAKIKKEIKELKAEIEKLNSENTELKAEIEKLKGAPEK